MSHRMRHPQRNPSDKEVQISADKDKSIEFLSLERYSCKKRLQSGTWSLSKLEEQTILAPVTSAGACGLDLQQQGQNGQQVSHIPG